MMNDFCTDILREVIKAKEDSLHQAVARNDSKRVNEFISSGADINKCIANYTPVQMSLALGNDDISKLLLSDPRLDPKPIDSLSWSYLSSIVNQSSVDIIKILFDHFITLRNTIKLFIDASCRIARVDLIQMFLKYPKLATHVRKNDDLYIHVCSTNSFSVLKFLVTNNIFNNYVTGRVAWLQRACETGNRNILRYIFCNWDIIVSGYNKSIALQDLVSWILKNDANIPVESLIECLQFSDATTIVKLSELINPHDFCKCKSDIAHVYLEKLDACLKPLSIIHWIQNVLQHKFRCTWYQPRRIVSKLIFHWHKAFAQYYLFCYFLKYVSSNTATNTSQSSSKRHDETWRNIEIFSIINIYQSLCEDKIDIVTNALYYAICYNQKYQVALFIENLHVDKSILTTKVPGKQISLIQFASQNETILRILTNSVNLGPKDRVLRPYIEWYESLDSLSSSSSVPYYTLSISQSKLVDSALPHDTIQKLDHIYCTFYESKTVDNCGKTLEKQRVYNAVRRLFHDIVIELGKRDFLFQCSTEFVGSSREGTRAFMPTRLLDRHLTINSVLLYRFL